MTGCSLDTDGDGNCPIHPKGCPSELAAMLARVCDAADAAIVSRDQDIPPHGAKGYVRVPERNALRAAVDAARVLLMRERTRTHD